MQSIEQLNSEFSFVTEEEASVLFKITESNIPYIEVKNKYAKATISLQGAHLLSWIPEAEDEVIWVSEDAHFSPGKSVRGGVPVCWPWFGAHKENKNYPAHGFARTVIWTLTNAGLLPTGEIELSFCLQTQKLSNEIQLMWPTATTVEYKITIGKYLNLSLTTHNNSSETVIIGQALHTYFNIGDITDIVITGLKDKCYLDKPDNFKRKKQLGLLNIDGEIDRIYIDTVDNVQIDNKKRKINIKKSGSHSTIVWNPGQKVANEMADLGEQGYRRMLCVESANAADDVVTLRAGEQHTLQVEYTISRSE